MDFKPFITYLLTEKRCSEHTALAYQNDLNQFSKYLQVTFETEDPKQVSFAMVRSYVVELMEEDYHPKSVNRKISSIKSYFRHLRKLGQVEVNPAARMQALKAPKRLVTAIGKDEMSNLLAEDTFFENDLNGIRARAIIELLYATGIRRSELISLKLQDVDFSAQTIRVTGKRNKTRLIPYPAGIEVGLKKYLDTQPRDSNSPSLFFLTNKQNKMYPKLVYEMVNRYLSYVTTADKKSPHVLRHTYATHLLNKGADVNDIKELLGHANLSATQIYTHNSFEQLKSEYNQSHPRETKND